MKLTEKFRLEAIKIQEKINDTANIVGLYYVVCFWTSPITNSLSHRVGYFDDVNEAIQFRNRLKSIYEDYNFPYYITSNSVHVNTIDGRLFD